MKNGATHLAYKAEQAVDLDTGAHRGDHHAGRRGGGHDLGAGNLTGGRVCGRRTDHHADRPGPVHSLRTRHVRSRDGQGLSQRPVIDVVVFEGGRSGFNTRGGICRLGRLRTVGFGGHLHAPSQPQDLPFRDSKPSLAMIGTITSAATGSAHHQPNNAFTSKPYAKRPLPARDASLRSPTRDLSSAHCCENGRRESLSARAVLRTRSGRTLAPKSAGEQSDGMVSLSIKFFKGVGT